MGFIERLRYIGGKPRRKGESKRGRGTKKVPVIGIYDKESIKVVTHAVLPEKGKAQLSGKQLYYVIDKYTSPDAVFHTDEFRSYRILDRLKMKHEVVNHNECFVDPITGAHTNNIENFWSLVKRMYHGTYHKMGIAYIDLYLGEQAFRYSNRFELEGIFDKVLKQSVLAA